MSFQVYQAQGLRIFAGDTATCAGYTGNAGEISVNTETKAVYVHDGFTAGGTPLTTAEQAELLGMTLGQLANVELDSPSDGQVLVYDEAAEVWKNELVAGAGGGAVDLDGLNDVELANPADNQVLTYNQGLSKWVNSSSSGGGFTEITPFAKEFSFSGTVNYEQTLTSSSVLNSARWVICDIFITANMSDHQNFKFSRTNYGNTVNWVNSRGERPSSQFENLLSQQSLTLTYHGESDGYSPNYGIWYPSQWLPSNGAKFWLNNYGNSGSAGWIYMIIKGWKA